MSFLTLTTSLTVQFQRVRQLHRDGRVEDPNRSLLFAGLDAAVLELAQRRPAELNAFVLGLQDADDPLDCFERYVALYGSRLAKALFFLHNWLQVVSVI